MGANLCILWHPTSDQKPNSTRGARDGRSSKRKGSWFENRTRFKGKQTKDMKRKTEMEAPAEKIPKAKKLTLEDWLSASSSGRGEFCAFKQSKKKKVHPCSSQFRGSLIGEAAIDSLSLARPMKHGEEDEGIISTCSSITTRSLSGKSEKRVRFKLPHSVIFFSPDKPYHCNEASLCSPEEEPYNNSSDSEDSHLLYTSPVEPNCRGNSLGSPEEPCPRLAVNTLPHVFVSSGI